MPTLFQDDLFGAAPVRTELPAMPDEPRPPRRRRIADTTLRAGRKLGSTQRQRDQDVCLGEIKSNGPAGRTRNEIEEHTNLDIRNICWAVDALLKQDLVFRPVVGVKDHGAPIYLTRDGCQVLVDALYRAQHEPRPRSITDELRRSA